MILNKTAVTLMLDLVYFVIAKRKEFSMIQSNKKKSKLVFLFLILILAGCSSKRETVDLIDNKGIFITNGEEITLPVLSLKKLDGQAIINMPYEEGIRFFPEDLEKYIFDKSISINRFSLEDINIMLNKNYKKPVMLQVSIGDGSGVAINWDHEWTDSEPELIFDITHQFSQNFPDANTLGVIISVFKLDEENIVTEIESYFMAIENTK